jgi:hypothetical protein
MSALNTLLGDEPRFLTAFDDDLDPEWAVRRADVVRALGPYWSAVAQLAAVADLLDRWGGRHDAVADCGDARADAAADIDAIAVRLQSALLLLDLIELDARERVA